MNDIVAAKVDQAIKLLPEFGLDAWIIQFARETYDHPEPVQELLVGTSITWPAAFLVGADGSRTAIVGTGDLTNVRDIGAYDPVIGYVRDVSPPLLAELARLDAGRIGLSYSQDEDSADNISHGMYLTLLDYLAETPSASRLVSADRLLIALRARKLPIEVERITGAITTTLDLFDLIERLLIPGVTERQIADAVHEGMRLAGVTPAWDVAHDPAVNFGPESPFGHAAPTEIALAPGMLVHVDLGVKRDGYCSDLQRMWYLLREDETTAPADLQRAFEAVRDSMAAGFAALQPGVAGWQVDDMARRLLVERGYPEPEFSLGHQLGQTTHDGGALLGPRWPRYRTRPELEVEEGNVFTLEYGVQTAAGTMALEQDVVVTNAGARYLTPPQVELGCLRV